MTLEQLIASHGSLRQLALAAGVNPASLSQLKNHKAAPATAANVLNKLEQLCGQPIECSLRQCPRLKRAISSTQCHSTQSRPMPASGAQALRASMQCASCPHFSNPHSRSAS